MLLYMPRILVYWLIDWLIDLKIMKNKERKNNIMVHATYACWLIDWLIDWLTDLLIGWLIDWLNGGLSG